MQIRDQYVAARSKSDLSIPIDVLVNFLVAVKLNLMIWWLEKEMPYSPEEMANMCTQRMLHGVGKLIKSKA